MYTVEIDSIEAITAEFDNVTLKAITNNNVNGNFEYEATSNKLESLYNFLLIYNSGDAEEALYYINAHVKHEAN
ncbi:MAG: hypothetical protein WBP82_09130 [Leuconostoc mesenteroides]